MSRYKLERSRHPWLSSRLPLSLSPYYLHYHWMGDYIQRNNTIKYDGWENGPFNLWKSSMLTLVSNWPQGNVPQPICVSSHFLENEKDPASASAHSQLLQVFWLRSWKIEWEMSKVRYRETKAKSIIGLPLILGKDVQGNKLQHCACMCPMIRQFFHSGGRATSGR